MPIYDVTHGVGHVARLREFVECVIIFSLRTKDRHLTPIC